MTENFKKYLILGFLFFFPIFVYVFLSTGINNFAKLPVLTYGVNDIVDLEGNLSKVSLKDNISIVGFWGGNIDNKKSEALNLNQKIYKIENFKKKLENKTLTNKQHLARYMSQLTAYLKRKMNNGTKY